ncbi:MAG: serine/threonine-protein phosphatase [Phycisphaerae bacterium]|nr:serine/threonine-protein phosphatase [Gemmatimonadaceae bacterium]
MTATISHPSNSPSGDDHQVVVRVFALTDVGHTRDHNEDTFLVAELNGPQAVTFQAKVGETQAFVAGEHGLLFLVADGMGGAASGELASSMASESILDSLRSNWNSKPSGDPESFATVLRDATVQANARIHQHSRDFPEHRGMGTTATVAGLLGDRLYLAQVGDSRAYVIRQGKAIQITKDQSLMQRLVEAGELTEAEAESSERRNIILQALGPDAHVTVDLTHQQIRRGDTLIICSDGLSGLVRGEEIARMAKDERDVELLCHRLVNRANELGGPDNITVIAAQFDGDGLLPATERDEIGHRPFPLAGTLAEEEERVKRVKPSPFKSDPTPALGVPIIARGTLEDEFARAHADEEAAHFRVEEDVLQERRKKAQPFMIALVVMGVLLAVWAIFALSGNDSRR